MRILLVEPNARKVEETTRHMEKAGFTVDHVDTGHDALGMLKSYNYDLAVMNVDLPDVDGFEVIRISRAARVPTPVMVLAEEKSATAKVRAFSTGADDYVTRPYESMELTARMQAVIRRSKGYSEPTLRAGHLELCLGSREVSVHGQGVHLTGKEYMILELLLLRKGMVLTKDAFLNHLYGGMDEPEMKIIDVFICKLRKKLQGAGAGQLIATVWGQGYVLRDEAGAMPTPRDRTMAQATTA
ncbi:Cell cycle transcriptional regulator CtrA [Gluconacetobacter sp. SXCC-1]|uniref:Response regulator transcription factor n=1 Tax=Komagataeibacter rhaeticus TaxID=215221 RepID=A0A181CDE9_9PROT|nr:response regulator transcription factor [Komagataeibacter rhaeticus]ATU74157.1 DNA-binding response regulator [Komagataeibacter xylinus]EGG77404.1 Cell cycle transcriptional regulator CtrA [Gluconacetobacter sp. SXCC-1]QIP36219.1 response regulator transcription factor [Komagataeibacter rhaeticus]QOC45978.1 response regulator transcription factor [Komagataeibacter rhaeticus]WPP21410.1 response regulator transcription factor [Komagataeibacter rhaeticus]